LFERELVEKGRLSSFSLSSQTEDKHGRKSNKKLYPQKQERPKKMQMDTLFLEVIDINQRKETAK
jgi:hypothetical protein